MKKLYEQVIQKILHSIGPDISRLEQENAIEFARNAFEIDQKTHDAIYKNAIKIKVSDEYLLLLNTF